MFVAPPDARTLQERLTGRGTEDVSAVGARLSRAAEEAAYMDAYDYLVINDTLDECVRQVHSIIRNEHRRVSRNREFISKIKEELKSVPKGDET